MKHPVIFGGLLAFASASVFAAMPEFAAIDRDGNGLISQEEATVSEDLAAAFTNADVDKDGSLSPEEYDALK